MSNGLDNPLLRRSSRFGYYSALDENTAQDPSDPDPREGSGRYKESISRDLYGAGSMVGRQDYVVGEDGNYYNEDGEQVYYWVRPRETDSTMRDYGTEEMSIGQDMGGYYTEAEIRGAWDADEGMGYFKKQTDWDNYWGYLTERQGMIQSGDLPDPTRPEYMDAFPARDVGEAPTPNVGSSFGGGREEEHYYAQLDAAGAEARNAAMAAFVDANAGLMQKYGISPNFQNKDGDTFVFNGSTYVRTDKVDDSFDVARFVGGLALSALTAGAAAFLAPALAGAIGVSNTIAKGLITAALDLAQGNDLDIGTALGLVGGDVLPGGVTLDELGAADDAVQSAIDAVVDELTNPDNYKGQDGNNTIVWGGHGGTDEMGNPVINIPNYEPTVDDSEDGGSDSSDGGSDSSDSSAGTDSGGDIGGNIGGNTGGEDSDVSGSIVARQIHEAILREEDPTVRDALIREWEVYTGKEWDEGYYDDNPYDPDQEREPIGHIWIPGDNVEGGLWYPVYDESEIPDDGTYVQGSEQPTAPPENTTGDTKCGVGEEPDGLGGCRAASDENTDMTVMIPSFGCESGYAYGDGTCVPVEEKNSTFNQDGDNTGGENQGGNTGDEPCPEGYSRSRNGECVKNQQGDMGGENQGGENQGGENQGGNTGDELCPEGYSRSRNGECVKNQQGDTGGKGTGKGPGDGPGDGTGEGLGEGPGMLSGGGAKGSYTPSFSGLFSYTTLTKPQEAKLAPYKDYVEQARGMMDDIFRTS